MLYIYMYIYIYIYVVNTCSKETIMNSTTGVPTGAPSAAAGFQLAPPSVAGQGDPERELPAHFDARGTFYHPWP